MKHNIKTKCFLNALTRFPFYIDLFSYFVLDLVLTISYGCLNESLTFYLQLPVANANNPLTYRSP